MSISTRTLGERNHFATQLRKNTERPTRWNTTLRREITVCCGATEGMIASLMGVTNPGDEIVLFEPFYENYRPDTLLCGAISKLVTLRPPHWTFDPRRTTKQPSPREPRRLS